MHKAYDFKVNCTHNALAPPRKLSHDQYLVGVHLYTVSQYCALLKAHEIVML